MPTRDSGHRVLPSDDVGVDSGRNQNLLAVEAAAVAAELAGATAVGLVVAPEMAHREDRLVDLAGGADQVAEGHVVSAPPVLALHRAAVCREGIDGVVDEELTRARVGPEDDGRHAHLVDLRAAALGGDLLERLR